jgi:hypothetical protein
MSEATMYLLAIIILIFISLVALKSTPKKCHLPMLWGYRGEVYWQIPRRWAVSVTPTIAALAFYLFLFETPTPDEIQSNYVHPISTLTNSIVFISFHLLHMTLAVSYKNKN